MSRASVRTITHAEDAALPAIVPLFEAMHAEMAQQGMLLRLGPDGARIWQEGIKGGLERFGRLAVAEADGQVVGFAHAVVKLAPEHLGGARIGHIAHVYVAPAHRRSGIARELVASLHAWLGAKQVASTELQVVHLNEAGLAFWRSLGYEPELVQLRKS
jgi:ribosomal protein S18 acetylase RimI-like enzyme